jgi:hypothetical protein
MSQTWLGALNQYNYPVDLSHFSNAKNYDGYFNQNIAGDRCSTIAFENYFRKNNCNIETWHEVVFWKMYSQGGRREIRTQQIIQQTRNFSGEQLTAAVKDFISDANRNTFKNIQKMLVRGINIAVVATFPAFVDPFKFPMVDTRVAKWVNSEAERFNSTNLGEAKLIKAQGGKNKPTPLTLYDFDFYLNWILWTREMASKLSKLTAMEWRARDVEMAVFTAWGNRGEPHPKIWLASV